MVRLLAFAGSTRQGSFNKLLVRNALEGARDAGADVTYLDLREYPLPLYDGDLEVEQGIPELAKTLKALMKDADGFIIASPEYNSGISGVLKNMIDWTSRPEPGEPSLACYAGKYAVIMSASPGALGGLRGLYHLRYVLENIQVTVLPYQVAVREAHQVFDEQGLLKDVKQREQVRDLGKGLTELLIKLSGFPPPRE